MADIEIIADLPQFIFLPPKAVFSSAKTAGTGAIRALRVDASRAIRAKKRFKVAYINARLKLGFPKAKDLDGLAWRMDADNHATPVSAFAHRQTKHGVTAKIDVGHDTTIKSAFIATTKTGHEDVFRRVGKKRLPIKRMLTSSVADALRDHGVIPGIQDRAVKVFKRDFERLLLLQLHKK
jgi:hypothetical protein